MQLKDLMFNIQRQVKQADVKRVLVYKIQRIKTNVRKAMRREILE